MHSACGRYVIVFNGEIYNHLALRKQLEARGSVAWRGTSDTETLLECCAAWGVAATLQKTVGMFALALWDRDARHLTLGRDRFGEKPLYYGFVAARRGDDLRVRLGIEGVARSPRVRQQYRPRRARAFPAFLLRTGALFDL